MDMFIGITGTIGAGKGTIVEYLKTRYGAKHYSARALLLEQLPADATRTQMVDLANSWREKFGPDYVVRELITRAKENSLAIVESLRTPAEVDFLKVHEGILFAVDAPVELRYERIMQRNSSTDGISYEKFLEDEKREANQPDPNKQNISACMQLADYLFDNNGEKEELFTQVDAVMKKLL